MPLRLIQQCAEFLTKEAYRSLPPYRRGIYVLYIKKRSWPGKRTRRKPWYDVLYVGMADFSMRKRLRSHAKRKKTWTHFSAYEVWPNITKDEIRELEGLFRHIYRYDARASILNLQRGFKAVKRLRMQDLAKWR